MANLDNFRGNGEQPIPQSVATWTVTATGSGASTITATKAAEADKTHFLCGFCVSTDFLTSYDPETSRVLIKDGTDIIFQTSIGASAHRAQTNIHANGPGPVIVNFSTPIQITEGALVSISVNPSGSNSAGTDANIWGFTNDTRIE